MRKKTLLYSLLKPLAMAAVAILPLNTVYAQSTPSITTVTEELKSALSDAISFAAHEYQYTNTNSVDVFAGYFTVNRSTFQYGGPLPFTYSWPNDYYSSAGSIGPTAELYNAYTFAEQLGYPEYKAIAQIVYGMTALRATNVKGAISYVDSRALKATRPLSYQSQEEAYHMILSDLDEAIETLESLQPDAATLQAIEGGGMAQGTVTAAYSNYDWRNWVKLANTIKLRLAMCLAKPDPKLARRVANEALSGTGVLDDDFGPTWVKGTDVHPAYYISSSKEGLGDCRMSASIENAMKRLGNPLIGTFFTTNSAQINDKTTGASMLAAGKDYVGIRQGVTMEPKSAGVGYYNFSEVNTPVKYIRPTWVCKEEVLFLKAEAALRWGIGGSAQQYYEAGIRAVFNRYGVSAGLDEYLARTEMVRKNGKNIDYIDYYVNSNSCDGRIAIGVKWDEGESGETKLEKIITQKWLSMFPNGGYEAWTDFRRTGYPRLFPVPEQNKWTGTPSFPVELQIRRIPNIYSYSTNYDFSLEKNYIGLDIYDEPQYINLTKKEGVSLNMSNDSPDVVAVELICDDETTCRLKLTPKAAGYADIMVSSSSCRKNIRVTVSEKMGISANEVKMNVNGSNSIYLRVHNSLSQYEVETSLTRLDGSGNEVLTQYSMEEAPSYSDFTKYEITFTAGSKAENLIFKATAKDRTITIPVYVSYKPVYLSYNSIDPSRPNDNIGTIKPLNINVSSQAEMQFNFYVGDQEILQEIIGMVKDLDNYKYDGSGQIMFGTPTVTSNANGTYRVSVPVYAGSKAGDGLITVNISGEKLTASVFIDDGKRYERVYISFTKPNTYTIPPTEMTFTTSKLVFSDESTFTIRVYHDISPDDRAEYIDWNITQSGDPICIEVGREVDSDYYYTDFKYMISGVPGTAVINFNVYNPQGELGGIYAEYLNQTITATVTVADKESFLVNSVTFNPDDIVTGAADVPLEAVMDPVVSSAAWPIEYSIIEGADLADISQGSSGSYQLNISKAGTIKVKAEAGPEGNKKSDILTVTAKLKLDTYPTKPLGITKAPSSIYVGDTYTIEKLLHANYTVDEDQYSWSSSAPGVISVDGKGNITAQSKGTAVITVSITDDYGNTATDQRTIQVKTLNISADFNTLEGYYVINNVDGKFWVDTELVSSYYYTFNLNKDILSMGDGVYTAGTDFTGMVTFPDRTACVITGGTITVSGGNVTFNLSVSYNSSITGKITGLKPILWL